MPPAVIAGGIAAVGAIGGAVIGSSAQKKAANQANDAQQAATQAQLQLGRETMALNKDIYNSNYGVLSPYASRGNVAGDSINALLGLPQAPAMTSPLANPSNPNGGGSLTPDQQWAQGAIDAMAPRVTRQSTWDGANALQDPTAKLNYILARSPASSDQYPLYQSYLGSHPHPQPAQTTPEAGTTTPAPTPVTGVSATDAMHNFANSAGMQFQLQQGENAINNGYAAKGQLQSGAAMKALQSFGQNTALNNYFMRYMGLLGGQQATGAGAASSIAGVGANFGNTAANINAGMGQNIQSGANAASNAALMRGQATSNMWGGIGSALGGLASSFAPTRGF